MAIPSVKGHPWYEYDWPRNTILGVAAIGSGLAALHKVGVFDLGKLLGPLGVVTVVALFLGWGYSIVQSFLKDQKKASADSPQDLMGCLYVVYHVLKQRQGLGDTPADREKLRVTIHKLDGDELEQCTEYLGGASNKNGARGRKTPALSGIIGLAARTGDVHNSRRTNDNYEEFVKEMVREWGFSHDQARKLTPDRQAWLAVPIRAAGDSVLAVVYLDSNERGFFTDDVRDLVIQACSGIRAFIDIRYGN